MPHFLTDQAEGAVVGMAVSLQVLDALLGVAVPETVAAGRPAQGALAGVGCGKGRKTTLRASGRLSTPS